MIWLRDSSIYEIILALCACYVSGFNIRRNMKDFVSSLNGSIKRRSFIKKSVIASVAASNLTMFQGLVNAQEQSSSGEDCEPNCELVKDIATASDRFLSPQMDAWLDQKEHYYRWVSFNCSSSGPATEDCQTVSCFYDTSK